VFVDFQSTWTVNKLGNIAIIPISFSTRVTRTTGTVAWEYLWRFRDMCPVPSVGYFLVETKKVDWQVPPSGDSLQNEGHDAPCHTGNCPTNIWQLPVKTQRRVCAGIWQRAMTIFLPHTVLRLPYTVQHRHINHKYSPCVQWATEVAPHHWCVNLDR